MHDIAKSAERYKVENSNTPTQSSISESDRAEMEEYIINLKLLVNTLGHKVFEDKRDSNFIKKQEYFSIKSVRGSNAHGEPTSDGFVVFKNSKASATEVSSISPSFVNMKQELISKGVLKLSGEVYEFTEDYIFSSPSSAAVIVMGRNANGPMEWKLADGTTLKEFESSIRLNSL